MKNLTRILLISLLASVGCSNYYRTADPGISASDVYSKYNSVAGQSAGVMSAGPDVSSPDTTLYYSEGPGPLGPVVSVAALVDFSPLGFAGMTTDNISDIVVFFAKSPSATSLTVSISGMSTQTFTGDGGSSDHGDYQVTVQGTAGSLVLESFDADSDGNLPGVIQLHVYTSDGSYIGKFSTLVGFSQ
jgi:hypothetical protein